MPRYSVSVERLVRLDVEVDADNVLAACRAALARADELGERAGRVVEVEHDATNPVRVD